MTDVAQDYTASAVNHTSYGPVTMGHLRRTFSIYGVVFLLGLLPLLTGADAAWKAFGQGLWVPGGGFLAVGGVAVLLFPATLVIFALAVFFWFGAGMVIAPPLVWLAAALLAGYMAGDDIWHLAPVLNALVAAGVFVSAYRRRMARVAAGNQVRQARAATLPQAVADAKAHASAAPVAGERELSAEDLASLRYALDRGLAPITDWRGFNKIDEFQTAARRYQINFLGYVLSTTQMHYTPSFHGYLSKAQRDLIDRYLQLDVWKYWIYETAWGHLNLTNFDPAARDNIMLTGFLGQQVSLYMSATGDRRYAEPGSLPFKLNDRTTFKHDVHSVADSVIKNFSRAPYCLYPCEPNWVYPICNHNGMTSLVIHDRMFGTSDVKSILDRWLTYLDRELTDPAGNIIGLRSEYTGIEFKFPTGEAGYAYQSNTFDPDRAWRQWATARQELQYILGKNEKGEKRMMLPGPGFDAGNYRTGNGMAYAGIGVIAREFGDDEIAEACLRALDEDCGRTMEGGVLRYTQMSNIANANAVTARLRRRDDWRNAITKGPPESVFRGPVVTDASYPDVLVAKAFSKGEDLELVLRNGRAAGPQTIGIERLKPGATYRVAGLAGGDTSVTAGADGKATLTVPLDGRVALHLTPNA